MAITIKPKEACRWDLVSLGEVMLRLDPGKHRVSVPRKFEASEGGGEYNVARGLKRCFHLDTAIATAFAANPVGELLEDLIRQGGVDHSLIRWAEHDGVGRTVRNGLNFTERGYGLRAALGCSDRGYTAASQLQPGDFDWDSIFDKQGTRWFHTGGIFCALSHTTAELTLEAVQAARRYGVIVSYDVNYRASLWESHGGEARVREINQRIAPFVDVMLGSETDLSSTLGFKVVAATQREVKTASRNAWGARCWYEGQIWQSQVREDLEIYDRVGGGDAFATGLIYGFLSGRGPQWAVECAAVHGALTMTTPGDESMVTVDEVIRVMEER